MRLPYEPQVSVVVPVQNGAATIAPCIEALLAQDYPRERTEIIVVDNGSSDETRNIVARYPVTLLVELDVRTSYAARNRGIAHASGEVIAFTDADCIAATDWLTHLVAPLADATVGAVVGGVRDAPPESLCEEFTARVNPFARPERSGLQTLLTGNVAMRRSTLEALMWFDECLPTGGDVDLGWRMQRELHLRLADAPAAMVFHKHRSTLRQVFAQYRRYGLGEILLATLHGENAGSTPVRQMLAQARAMVSYGASLAYRSMRSPFVGFDRRYLLWPLFLFAVEAGNVVGKLEGLVATRGCRRNPYPNPRLGRTYRAVTANGSRALSESSTGEGTRRATSPPSRKTSLTRREET